MTEQKKYARQIAIDGPAGAGKSTIAKIIASRLGYIYVDTGAMYRVVGMVALDRGISLEDEAALTKLAEELRIELSYENEVCRVFCNGEEVTSEIRRPDVGQAASTASAFGGVRRALVAQQRRMAAEHCVVMDGRDIGTMVLPQAECKIYLTAALEVRAMRRYLELQAKGSSDTLENVTSEMVIRDTRDMNRAESPLRKADDAVEFDNGDLSIEETVNGILKLAEKE